MVAFFASAVPLAQGLPRVALLMAAAPLLNGTYVVAALGWFPGGADLNLRIQSGMALHNSLALSGLMLLMLRTRSWVWRAWFVSLGIVLCLAVLAWNLEPRTGMLIGTGYAWACTLAALILLFSPTALRNHRLAWLAVCSVASVSLGLAGTAWIAAAGQAVPWQLHAGTAAVVAAHEICMGFAVWSQFSHLAELRLVRAYGAGYDPVTRMRSLETTGHLINSVFSSSGSSRVGAIVINVANLHALESIYGRAEHNQALFILAMRLRNSLPRGVQMGRLGPDVFLMLFRRSRSEDALLSMARRVLGRLTRAVSLGSGDGPAEVNLGAHQWTPEIGIGVLRAPREMNRATAVNLARNMSRTALTYASRIARYDEETADVAESVAPASRRRPREEQASVPGSQPRMSDL